MQNGDSCIFFNDKGTMAKEQIFKYVVILIFHISCTLYISSSMTGPPCQRSTGTQGKVAELAMAHMTVLHIGN